MPTECWRCDVCHESHEYESEAEDCEKECRQDEADREYERNPRYAAMIETMDTLIRDIMHRPDYVLRYNGRNIMWWVLPKSKEHEGIYSILTLKELEEIIPQLRAFADGTVPLPERHPSAEHGPLARLLA
jgi:hypothetical protein